MTKKTHIIAYSLLALGLLSQQVVVWVMFEHNDRLSEALDVLMVACGATPL